MNSEDKIIQHEVLRLVDPNAGTKFEKARRAFISFQPLSGTIAISAFLGRAMGLVSGSRVAFVQAKDNELQWFICKLNQHKFTKGIKILNGAYRIHSKEWCEQIGKSFRFGKPNCFIRLYANIDSPIDFGDGGIKGIQLFDMPHAREDFKTEEEHVEYVKFMNDKKYILKQDSNDGNTK